MKKAELRKIYRQQRAALSPTQIDALSIKIAGQLASLISGDEKNIHLFLPITKFNEINTYLIKDLLHEKFPTLNWIISRTDFDSLQMHHFIWDDETHIITSAVGIPEPENGIEININSIDVVLVPLLAFDNNGHRLGYGKGFYDRFLRHCADNCKIIGLSIFPPTDELLPSDGWDIPLQFCATPEKTYRF